MPTFDKKQNIIQQEAKYFANLEMKKKKPVLVI